MRRLLLVTLACLCLASPLHAQIARDAVVGDGTAVTATSQTTAFTMSGTAGGCLVAGFLGDATADSVTGATFNGVAMTLVNKQNSQPGSVYWQYLYALPAPASGTHNIVVSASGSIHLVTFAISYTGVAPTKCPEVSAQNSGGGNPYTSSITTVTLDSWIVTFINNSATVADSTNFTTRASDGMGFVQIGDSGDIPTTGAVNVSVTGVGQKQSALVALAPASGSASRMLLLGVAQ